MILYFSATGNSKYVAERIAADTNDHAVSIETNPRVALAALASRFEDTKAKYEKVTSDIAAKGIRRRELERFILAVEKLPEMVTDFDEALWGSLVDHLTVNGKDDIVFTMSSGMEIKA